MKIARNIALVLATLVIPVSAFAASLTLAPTSVAPAAGKTFVVTITADSAGAKAYTMRANVSFNPALVQFVSFSFAPKWIVLSQAGYDSEDNANGVLVKTAGYPGGITAPTVFGTVTFRAIATGSSVLRVTTDSLALDGAGKNLISGAQGTTEVTVAAPVKATPTPTAKFAVKSTKKTVTKPAATPKKASVVLASPATSTLATSSAMAAAAASGFSFGSSRNVWPAALALVIIIGGFWFYTRRKQG